MNKLLYKNLRLAVIIILFFSFSINAQAACNNEKNWFDAPDSGIKVFIGYKQEQKPGFGAFGIGQSPVDYPYPERLPKDMLGKEGTGSLSEESSDVSYYEPDGKGNWRVCRTERWWPAPTGDLELRRSLEPIAKRYAAKNPILKKIADKGVIKLATMYFYDAKGRIIRLEEGDFQKPERKAAIKICREYDKDDNLTLLLDPKTSQSCRASPPDLRDEWMRYRYGKYDDKLVGLRDEWHTGDSDGNWSKTIRIFRTGPEPDAIFGGARAKSGKGVTVIYGSNAGKLDNNAANTVLNAFGKMNAASYWFIKHPTPLEVLDKPDLIYQYDRRRQTYIDGTEVKLFELFKANEHRSLHRYYLMGPYVVRHEQFDSSGRVKRVITIDDWRQPRPGPKPDIDDKLLTDKGLSIKAHQIYHRVYEFDAQGKPTLVAVSWSRAVRNPLKKASARPDDLAYGSPSGKELWKSEEDFFKRFDFSPEARQVFPDVANGEDPEKI